MRETLLSECIHQLCKRCALDCCILLSADGTVLAAEKMSWVPAQDVKHLGSLAGSLHVEASSIMQEFSLINVKEVGICLSDDFGDRTLRIYLRPVGAKAVLLNTIDYGWLERGFYASPDLAYAMNYLDALLSGSPQERLQWPTDLPK